MSKHSPDADVDFISALVDLLNRSELTELSVKREYGDDDSLEVHVVRQSATMPVVMPAQTNPNPVITETIAAPASVPDIHDEPAHHPGIVPSPMVGTVYLSPEPGAAPFISLGDQVSEGQTLLIVEAMKTMNQIISPRSGIIKRILVEDGTPIEYGAPLVIIE